MFRPRPWAKRANRLWGEISSVGRNVHGAKRPYAGRKVYKPSQPRFNEPLLYHVGPLGPNCREHLHILLVLVFLPLCPSSQLVAMTLSLWMSGHISGILLLQCAMTRLILHYIEII